MVVLLYGENSKPAEAYKHYAVVEPHKMIRIIFAFLADETDIRNMKSGETFSKQNSIVIDV